MLSYRNYLLDTFGLDNEYAAIVCPDIRLQKCNEREPFGEIVTTNGKTTLRIGQALSKGPILKVR